MLEARVQRDRLPGRPEDLLFEHPEGGKSTGDQLLSLGQGKNTAAENVLTLAGRK